MTIALCLNCGDLKFGSFVACKSCGAMPQGKKQHVYSLVLSDHYFDKSQLEQFSLSMKEGHPHPVLSPDQEKKFMEGFGNASGKPDDRTE